MEPPATEMRGGVGVGVAVDQEVARLVVPHVERRRVGRVVERRVQLAEQEHVVAVVRRVRRGVGLARRRGVDDERAVETHGGLVLGVGKRSGLVEERSRTVGGEGVRRRCAGGDAGQVGHHRLSLEEQAGALPEPVVQGDRHLVADRDPQCGPTRLGGGGVGAAVPPDCDGLAARHERTAGLRPQVEARGRRRRPVRPRARSGPRRPGRSPPAVAVSPRRVPLGTRRFLIVLPASLIRSRWVRAGRSACR